MNRLPNTVLRIGNQELIPMGYHYRFSIRRTMPERGFKFKFGIRERILDEMIERGTNLEVVFPEFPKIKFNENPAKLKEIGKRQKQVGFWKDNPFWHYWFFVDFKGDLARRQYKNAE